MKYGNRQNSRTVFVRFFILLSTIVYLIKIESSLFVHTDYCYHPEQTEIELVFSERPEYLPNFNLEYNSYLKSQKPIIDSEHTRHDYPSINKYLLINFNNYVLNKLYTLKFSSIHNDLFVSSLQKNNIWHQSSDEDPHFLVQDVG